MHRCILLYAVFVESMLEEKWLKYADSRVSKSKGLSLLKACWILGKSTAKGFNMSWAESSGLKQHPWRSTERKKEHTKDPRVLYSSFFHWLLTSTTQKVAAQTMDLRNLRSSSRRFKACISMSLSQLVIVPDRTLACAQASNILHKKTLKGTYSSFPMR